MLGVDSDFSNTLLVALLDKIISYTTVFERHQIRNV